MASTASNSTIQTDEHQRQLMLSSSSPKPYPLLHSSDCGSTENKILQNSALPILPFSSSTSDINSGSQSSTWVEQLRFGLCSARTTSSMHEGSSWTGSPIISPKQHMEIENQALILRYLNANVPIPSNLLMSIRKSSSSSISTNAGVLQPTLKPLGTRPVELNFSRNHDPEPGRCRRTDGKKWRCSRDAVVNQKYCVRHLNRGRPLRSRKPVEGHTGQAASGSQSNGGGSSSRTCIRRNSQKKDKKVVTKDSPVLSVLPSAEMQLSNSIAKQPLHFRTSFPPISTDSLLVSSQRSSYSVAGNMNVGSTNLGIHHNEGLHHSRLLVSSPGFNALHGTNLTSSSSGISGLGFNDYQVVNGTNSNSFSGLSPFPNGNQHGTNSSSSPNPIDEKDLRCVLNKLNFLIHGSLDSSVGLNDEELHRSGSSSLALICSPELNDQEFNSINSGSFPLLNDQALNFGDQCGSPALVLDQQIHSGNFGLSFALKDQELQPRSILTSTELNGQEVHFNSLDSSLGLEEFEHKSQSFGPLQDPGLFDDYWSMTWPEKEEIQSEHNLFSTSVPNKASAEFLLSSSSLAHVCNDINLSPQSTLHGFGPDDVGLGSIAGIQNYEPKQLSETDFVPNSWDPSYWGPLGEVFKTTTKQNPLNSSSAIVNHNITETVAIGPSSNNSTEKEDDDHDEGMANWDDVCDDLLSSIFGSSPSPPSS